MHYFEYGQVLGHEGVGILVDIGRHVPAGQFAKGETLAFGIQLSVLSSIFLLDDHVVMRIMSSLSRRTRNLLS